MGKRFSKFQLYLVACIAINIFYCCPARAASVPNSFSLDGTVYDSPSGTSVLLDTVVIRVQILNPAKTCVLYDEQQTVNTTTTNGIFSIQVGSATGAAKRVSGSDSNNAMSLVFQNQSAIDGNNHGCTYTPAAGDIRYARVMITPQSTGVTETLSPDMTVGSIPSALVADTLQGLGLSSFLLVNGSANLTQSNLESLFTGSNYSALYSVASAGGASTGGSATAGYVINAGTGGTGGIDFQVNGSSKAGIAHNGDFTVDNGSLFVQASSDRIGIGSTSPLASLDLSAKTDALMLPVGTTLQRPSPAYAGMIRFNTNASKVEFYDGSGWSSMGADITGISAGGDLAGTYPNPTVARLQGVAIGTTAPVAGQFLKYGTNWSPSNLTFADVKTTGGLATLASGVCNAGQSMYYDTSTGDLKCQAIDLSNASVTGPLAVTKGGTGLSSGTVGAIPYFSTTTAISALAAGTAGYVLTSNGANTAPSWQAAPSGGSSQWTNITGGISYSGGNVGIGTTTPGLPLVVQGVDNYGILEVVGDGTNYQSAIGLRSRNVAAGSTGAWEIGAAGGAAGNFFVFTAGTGQVITATTGGNVGIDSASPVHTLDVAGNIGLSASKYINFGANDGSGGYGIRDNGGTIEIKNSGGTWAAPTGGSSQWSTVSGGINYSGGNVGIGSAVPGRALDLVVSTNTETGIHLTNAQGGNAASSNILFDNEFNSSRVGIYSSNNPVPFANRFAVLTSSYGLNLMADATGGDIQLYTNGSAAANERMRITSAGNVGIGSTSPGHKLDVNGNVGLAASSYVNFGTANGSSGYGIRDNGGTIEIKNNSGSWSPVTTSGLSGSGTIGYVSKFGSSSTSLTSSLLYDNGTNMGIGTTAPAALLDVSGNGDFGTLSVRNQGVSGESLFNLYAPLSTGIGDGKAFAVTAGNEGYARAMFYTDGKYGLGGGSGPRDVFLSRHAAGVMKVSADGASSAANFVVAGNVGVGTLAPGARLEVTSSAANTSGLKLTNLTSASPTGTGQAIGVDASGNVITVTGGGSSQWTSGTGLIYYNGGNVGIGSSAPGQKLTLGSGNIAFDNSYGIYLNGATDGSWQINRSSSPGFTRKMLYSASTNIITSGNSGEGLAIGGGGNTFLETGSLGTYLAGNVGIGSSSPAHKLDVTGNVGISASGYVNFGTANGSSGYGIRDNGGIIEIKNSGGSWAAPAGGSSQWSTVTGGIAYTGGNVGIGTSAPGTALQIGTQGVNLNSDPTVAASNLGALSIWGNNQLLSFGMGNNGTAYGQWIQSHNVYGSAFSLDLNPAGGSVGVNTYTPLSALDVGGGVAVGSYASTTAAPTNGLIVSGNVGIGSSAPGQKLSVAGTIESTSGGIKYPDGTVQTTAPGSATINIVTGSRAFGTTYQNTSGKTMLVTISGSRTAAGNTMYLTVGPSAGSLSNVGAVAFPCASCSIQLVGMVPPSYYYQLSNDGGSPSIVLWVENILPL